MPSFRSRLLSGTIKSVKPWLTGMDIPRQRRGMTMLGRLLPKPRDVQVEKAAEDCPLNARWARPREPVKGKVILYTHGGSYVSGSPETHETVICRLAERCRVEVFAYDYRLAPEHPYPAALQDAPGGFRLFACPGLCRRGYFGCAGIRREVG